jgi:hypothetical protein
MIGENLPVYELTIDESDDSQLAVFAVGLVSRPAIERNWMAFASQNIEKFTVFDDEKRILAGPLMVANQKIPRVINDEKCYVVFTADGIEKMVNKFFKKGYYSNFNIQHDDNQKVSDCYMVQSFIINSDMGINTPKGFDKLDDGSWFGFVKIDNDKVWEDFIKTGELKGFSVEGFFDEAKVKLSDIDFETIQKLKTFLT